MYDILTRSFMCVNFGQTRVQHIGGKYQLSQETRSNTMWKVHEPIDTLKRHLERGGMSMTFKVLRSS
jgi:hypothetical protein